MPAPEARRRARNAPAGLQLGFAIAVGAMGAGGGARGSRDARADAPPFYETVVTAGPADDARHDAAASASAITRDRTPRGVEHLPELLAELPGVAITRYGGLGALSTISLRGSAANQVQIYVDGVPLGTATGGGIDLGLIPVHEAERIEIYRGVTPLVFGATSLAGVVSIESRLPADSGGGVEIGAGSFGTRAGVARAHVAEGRWRGLASVALLASDGDFPFPDDRGTAFDASDDALTPRRNNELRQADALAQVEARLRGRRWLRLTSSWLQRDQGVPAAGGVEARRATLATRRGLATVRYESSDDLGLGGRLRAQAWTTGTRQRFRDLAGEVAMKPTDTDDRTVALGGVVSASRPVAAWLRLAVALDGRHESFAPSDATLGDPGGPPADRVAGAAGVEADAAVDAVGLRVLPSLRLEAARDRITGRNGAGAFPAEASERSYVYPVGRLGLLWRRGRAAARANVGRYARLPTTVERYGNTGFIAGSPGLAPEVGATGDLGATAAWGRGPIEALLDAAVFAARVEDLIHFQQVSQGYLRARNVGRARVLGAEASLDVAAMRRIHFLARGTYTDARDVSGRSGSDGRQIPHRPRARAYARLEARELPLAAGWRCGVYGDADATGGNYLDSANLVEVPPRLLWGAGAHAARARSGLRVVLAARNLGDSRVNDVAGFPLPGRSVFVTLEWQMPETSKGELIE